MPYPRRLLNDDEEIVVDIRPHWWFFWKPTLALLGAGALAIVAFTLELDDWVRWLTLGLVALALLWFAGRWVKWATTNFVVTSDRLIWRTGVFAKSGLEIPLERVNNILFNQTFFERLLRSGDLMIESAGESGQQRFSDISDPSRVQNQIHRAMEDATDRDADRTAGGRPFSVADELGKLDDLRRRGVLSEEEFARHKAELLGEGEPTG